jgi:phosphoribosylformimino-5-aminoimidazole carboxamide ribonucleotide (ProFAR) isomerase
MITIIPAIDLIDAKCVRLSQGDYNQKTIYNENPLEVAKMFEDAGITRLHLVDLDGAKAKHIVNHKVLENIASKTSLMIDFGGGLKSDEDLRIAFESGAQMVTGGSIAVKDRETFPIRARSVSYSIPTRWRHRPASICGSRFAASENCKGFSTRPESRKGTAAARC